MTVMMMLPVLFSLSNSGGEGLETWKINNNKCFLDRSAQRKIKNANYKSYHSLLPVLGMQLRLCL